MPADTISRQVSWAEFQDRFRWAQGEHVAAVAPTGAGKTTLFSELMPYRRYNIMLGTKPDDPMYHEIIRRHGYRRIQDIDDIKSYDEKVLLWPKAGKTIKETMLHQQQVFRDAFDAVVKQRAWTLWVDEAKYMAQHLHLSTELTYCLEQLRSINSTIICGAQRPAWLPSSTLPNSTHIFMWKNTRAEDAKRLADVGGIDSKAVGLELKTLDKHEFLYIESRGTEGTIYRSQVGK